MAEKKPRRRASTTPRTPSRRQAPGAAVAAADPALQAAEDGGAGAVGVGEGFEEPCPQAGLRPAAELAGGGVGLAELRREGAPGGQVALRAGGHPEDGVEAPARVAHGAAGGAGARSTKGASAAHSSSDSGSQGRWGE
jgi:hypothetical protein